MSKINTNALSKDQSKATDDFMDFLLDSQQKYFVIQGAAGSGKSYLMQYLLDTYESRYKAYNLLLNKQHRKQYFITLAASTNKAARVMQNFVGDAHEVRTLHSVLGLRVVNNTKTGKTELHPKDSDTITNTLMFVDEASFIDEELFSYLDGKTLANCKIVLIGDAYQLAPVGSEFSVMETLGCNKTTLSTILRNSGDIAKTSAQLRETVQKGQFKPIKYNTTSLIHANGDDFKKLINDCFLAPGWKPSDAKILAWTNSRVQEYNRYIRMLLQLPEKFQVGETVVTNSAILAKDHVFQIDTEVRITRFLGDTIKLDVPGRMIEIDNVYSSFLPDDFKQVKILLRQLAKEKNWKDYFMVKEKWFDLRSVYASSVHKSQGSTYKRVFVDLGDIGRNWERLEVARLMYVAISRASEQVICNGSLPARYTA